MCIFSFSCNLDPRFYSNVATFPRIWWLPFRLRIIMFVTILREFFRVIWRIMSCLCRCGCLCWKCVALWMLVCTWSVRQNGSCLVNAFGCSMSIWIMCSYGFFVVYCYLGSSLRGLTSCCIFVLSILCCLLFLTQGTFSSFLCFVMCPYLFAYCFIWY